MNIQSDARAPIQGTLKAFVIIGFIALALSLLNFWLGDNLLSGESFGRSNEKAFLISGFLTYAYFISIIIYGFVIHGIKIWRLDTRLFHLAIVLYGVFAFTVNRYFMVGDELIGKQPAWLEAVIFIAFGGILLDIFRENLSPGVRYVQMVLAGVGSLISIYFALVMLPILPISLLVSFFFGLSLVITSPFWALLAFFRVYRRNKEWSSRIPFWVGFGVPLLFVLFYTLQWSGVVNDIQRASSANKQTGSQMPDWVTISQHIQDRPFLHSILNNQANTWGNDNFRLFNVLNSLSSFDGEINPFAVIAGNIVGPTNLSHSERIDIANALMDLRYESEPRLWSDDDLKTAKVETEIEVFADYRLAYVEKKIQIHRNGSDFRNSPREAIYTFHLPEGSCATSLSLWVNGIEEKARMDSKEKTTAAYETIVGREMRDPSLVTWMEGNALMVRVFPVTTAEDREFKLGMTIPLESKDGTLTLNPVYFEGPGFGLANEKISLQFRGSSPEIISGTEKLTANENGKWEGVRRYSQDRSLVVKAPPLASGQFVFEGLAWHMEDLQPQSIDFRPAALALDIDRGWTKTDYNACVDWAFAQNLKLLAFTQEMVEITPENRNAIFSELSRIRFSLFPFQLLPNPERTIVVTNSTLQSPMLGTLSGHTFSSRLAAFLEGHPPVKVFHTGTELSPYLRSLKEVRAIDYQQGSWEDLKTWMAQGKYPFVAESDQRVANHISGVRIVQDSVGPDQRSDAPDHLMRLFTYNLVVRKIGVGGLFGEPSDSALVQEARRAFVVTPFTKLVVLETKADYDRFDIADNDGTLGNAGNLSSVFGSGNGSVPEPHEWALIVLTLLVAVWLYRKRKLAHLNG